MLARPKSPVAMQYMAKPVAHAKDCIVHDFTAAYHVREALVAVRSNTTVLLMMPERKFVEVSNSEEFVERFAYAQPHMMR